MGEESKINWTDHTWNPWIGCTKVSDGCKNCYAERMAHHRKWAEWGAGKPRRRAAESMLRKPFAWNRKTEKAGVRTVVFCGSLMDVFDPEVPDEWRDHLFATIALTPHLNWVLLTKRVEEGARYLASADRVEGICEAVPWESIPRRHGFGNVVAWGERGEPMQDLKHWPLPNVWIGASICNQADLDKHGRHLLRIAGMGWPVWVSAEPLLGAIDWTQIKTGHRRCQLHPDTWNALTGEQDLGHGEYDGMRERYEGPRLSCIVFGGESGTGPGIRPMHPDWARETRDQCLAAGVVSFHKQHGEWAPAGDPLMQSELLRLMPLSKIQTMEDGTKLFRVGTKAAGRKLYGKEDDPRKLPWFQAAQSSSNP